MTNRSNSFHFNQGDMGGELVIGFYVENGQAVFSKEKLKQRIYHCDVTETPIKFIQFDDFKQKITPDHVKMLKQTKSIR